MTTIKYFPPLTNEQRDFVYSILDGLPDSWRLYTNCFINGVFVPALFLSKHHGVLTLFFSPEGISNTVEELSDNRTEFLKYLNKQRQIPDRLRTILSYNASNNTNLNIESAVIYDDFDMMFESKYMQNKKSKTQTKLLSHEGLFEVNGHQRLRSIFREFFKSVEKQDSKYLMNTQLFEYILSWVDKEFTKNRRLVKLKGKHLEIATTEPRHRDKNNVGYRRIKGPAGSGKTLVLVTRVAELLSQNKKVLVLNRNIAIQNNLFNLINDALQKKGEPLSEVSHLLEVFHFHGFIAEFCDDFSELRTEEDWEKYVNRCYLKFSKDSPKNAGYDAIVIDEGQDWKESWWKFIPQLIKPNGEVLFCADKVQNLYGTKPWTESTMKTAGFAGPWHVLNGCYRLPDSFISIARCFADDYLDESSRTDLSTFVKPGESFNLFEKFHLRWVQLPEITSLVGIAAIAAKEIIHLPEVSKKYLVHPVNHSDVVFLTQTRHLGEKITSNLQDNDFQVMSAFNREGKVAFDLQSSSIKGITIKSFKGQEAHSIVLIIDQKPEKQDESSYLKEIFVGLTRLKKHENGSILTVICKNPSFYDFAKNLSREDFCDFIDLSNYKNIGYIADETLNLRLKKRDPDESFDINFQELFKRAKLTDGEIRKELNPENNANNSEIQNLEYLHHIFPRSFAESFKIFSNLLKNPVIKTRFQQKKTIRILSYGCGTGGDVLGMLAAFKEAGIGNSFFEVYAIDANKNALEKAQKLIKVAKIDGLIPEQVNFRYYTYWVKDFDFGLKGWIDRNIKLDIIETSKFLNELLNPEYIEDEPRYKKQGVYYQFYQKVSPLLEANGLFVVIDVARLVEIDPIEDERSKDTSNTPSEKWVAELLDKQSKNFVKNSQFCILLPRPCQQCINADRLAQKPCYLALQVKYFCNDYIYPVGVSNITYRVLAHKSFYDEINSSLKCAKYYIVGEIKDGTKTVCPSPEPLFSSVEKLYGYDL